MTLFILMVVGAALFVITVHVVEWRREMDPTPPKPPKPAANRQRESREAQGNRERFAAIAAEDREARRRQPTRRRPWWPWLIVAVVASTLFKFALDNDFGVAWLVLLFVVTLVASIRLGRARKAKREAA